MRDLQALAPPESERLVEQSVVARRLGLAADDPEAGLYAEAASSILTSPEGIGRPVGWQLWRQRVEVTNLPTPAVVLAARPVTEVQRVEIDNRTAESWRLVGAALLYLDDARPGEIASVEYWAGWRLPGWDDAPLLGPTAPPALPADLALAARVLAEHLHDGAGLDGVVEESFAGGARLRYDATPSAMPAGVRRIAERYR